MTHAREKIALRPVRLFGGIAREDELELRAPSRGNVAEVHDGTRELSLVAYRRGGVFHLQRRPVLAPQHLVIHLARKPVVGRPLNRTFGEWVRSAVGFCVMRHLVHGSTYQILRLEAEHL
jgi:hypothetical protein